MVTTGDLTRMKQTLATTWTDTIVVERPTHTSDGQGGETSTWAAAGTYLGRVAYVTARAGEERSGGGRAEAESPWVVTLPASADVRDTDRITYAGGTLDVVHVRTPVTWQMTTRVECIELS